MTSPITRPLLDDPEYVEFQREIQSSKSCSKAFRKCAYSICLAVSLLLVLSIVAIKLVFFHHVSHGPPELNNSTAIEPNTHTEFPLLLLPPNGGKLQALLGVDAWEYTIPIPYHPKIVIGALGFYVDKVEGRRRLKRFQHKSDIDPELVFDVLMGKGMGESLRIVLHGNPPSGKVLQWWEEQTLALNIQYCGSRSKAEFASFAKFFGTRKFKDGDDMTFERRENELLIHFQGHPPKRTNDGCFARALLETHLRYQKSGLFNLLEELF